MDIAKIYIDVDIFWNNFAHEISKGTEEELNVLDKLLKITNSLDERKKVFYSLVKSYMVSKGKYSLKRLKKFLCLFNLTHLTNKIVLDFEVGLFAAYRDLGKKIEILAITEDIDSLFDEMNILFQNGIIKDGEILRFGIMSEIRRLHE